MGLVVAGMRLDGVDVDLLDLMSSEGVTIEESLEWIICHEVGEISQLEVEHLFVPGGLLSDLVISDDVSAFLVRGETGDDAAWNGRELEAFSGFETTMTGQDGVEFVEDDWLCETEALDSGY